MIWLQKFYFKSFVLYHWQFMWKSWQLFAEVSTGTKSRNISMVKCMPVYKQITVEKGIKPPKIIYFWFVYQYLTMFDSFICNDFFEPLFSLNEKVIIYGWMLLGHFVLFLKTMTGKVVCSKHGIKLRYSGSIPHCQLGYK